MKVSRTWALNSGENRSGGVGQGCRPARQHWKTRKDFPEEEKRRLLSWGLEWAGGISGWGQEQGWRGAAQFVSRKQWQLLEAVAARGGVGDLGCTPK